VYICTHLYAYIHRLCAHGHIDGLADSVRRARRRGVDHKHRATHTFVRCCDGNVGRVPCPVSATLSCELPSAVADRVWRGVIALDGFVGGGLAGWRVRGGSTVLC
jgi:hypothetical protein